MENDGEHGLAEFVTLASGTQRPPTAGYMRAKADAFHSAASCRSARLASMSRAWESPHEIRLGKLPGMRPAISSTLIVRGSEAVSGRLMRERPWEKWVVDYTIARADAIRGLGDRYLLARPINRPLVRAPSTFRQTFRSIPE